MTYQGYGQAAVIYSNEPDGLMSLLGRQNTAAVTGFEAHQHFKITQ